MSLSPGTTTPELTARPPAGVGRPQVSAVSLWTRGLIAACAAILGALSITLLIRGFLGLSAFEVTGSRGDPNIGPLSLGVFTATLLAVLVLHVLLLRAGDRAGRLFATVMALAFLAFAAVTFTGHHPPSRMFGDVIVCAALAIAIGLLVAWAGRLTSD